MKDKHKTDRETGSELNPKYDSNGLISAVVTDSSSGNILMVAFMNAEALDLTLKTDVAHFYSRSRQTLWKKGETSGNILNVVEVLIDCDQDALWIKAKPSGPTCHTGADSCFYRKIENGQLRDVE
ncbi:phosphoribosyl-AMP cyclohydrolase [Parasphingorhabdus sp. JC815]|uniref:phosphoribosyl-AMP cyclohydrolase n=1 Tax=Parasphingorhabdus sp. JC815 TaxID=3232140 RepID=UPI003457912E